MFSSFGRWFGFLQKCVFFKVVLLACWNLCSFRKCTSREHENPDKNGNNTSIIEPSEGWDYYNLSITRAVETRFFRDYMESQNGRQLQKYLSDMTLKKKKKKISLFQ